MRTAALVYSGSITSLALDPLGGGASAYERVLSFVRELPGLQAALVLEGGVPLPEGPYARVRRERWSPEAILEEAERFTSSFPEPLDALFVLRGDEPLLDPALAARMASEYRRYRAEFSYADGYPQGLCVEILHPRILPALRVLAAKNPLEPDRGWLFNVIQKDINSFDIETEISPRDLRDERLSLAADTRRNKLLVERLMAAGARDAATVLEIVPERPELLRTLPAFAQVQVTEGCPQSCSLCPYPAFAGDPRGRRGLMPRSRFAALMAGLVEFAGDAVVDLSLWGEPALHPEIEGLIDDVLVHQPLSLIVESSGIGWDAAVLERLAARWPERLHWVLSLDAASPETYARLRGKGWEEAQATAERLLALFPRSAYVQMVRCTENEEELEAFWRGWKKRTENVIIQKYSRFAGFLPERKVTDLSPLGRKPCRHLLRDFSILLDGRVPLCRECVRGEIVLGNLFEGLGAGDPGNASRFRSAFERIWAAGAAFHELHIRGEYPEPCAVCDEYYTYNA